MITSLSSLPKALPDLVISRISAREAEVLDRVTLDVDVTNRGPAPAGPFQVEVQVEDIQPHSNTKDVSGLGAGKTSTLTFGPLPVNWGGTQLLTIDATADSANQVEESDKSNNASMLFLTAPNPNPWPPEPPIPPIPMPHPHALLHG